jgi:hypothetical protein
MTEERERYRAGPTNRAEPLLTTEALVAAAHANRQGIPYETGEQLLAHLPQQMRALADVILGGKMTVGDVAYAVAALIDRIENAPGDMDHKLH